MDQGRGSLLLVHRGQTNPNPNYLTNCHKPYRDERVRLKNRRWCYVCGGGKHKQLTFREPFLLVSKSLPMSLASPPSRGVLTITVPYCFVILPRSTAAYCNAGMVFLGFKCQCSLERKKISTYKRGEGEGVRSGPQTLLHRFSLIPPPPLPKRELDLDDDLTDQDRRV